MNFKGVIPAALTPWREDLGLDVPGLKHHLRCLIAAPKVSGVLVNGNTSEASACSPKEQAEIVAIAKEITGSNKSVISGIQLMPSEDLADRVQALEKAGADAFLVYPLDSNGGQESKRYIDTVKQWGHLSEVTKLPLIHFQYPASSGKAYDLGTIDELASTIPNFAGVKDFCSDESLHRQIIELMHEKHELIVLTSHVKWLGNSLAMGADGICAASGCLFSDLQSKIYGQWLLSDGQEFEKLLAEFYHCMAPFESKNLIEQLPKFKLGAVAHGHFEQYKVRPPLENIDQHGREDLLRVLGAIGHLYHA